MMSLASICVLMSCLVLIGSATMIFLNIDSLLARIEEENAEKEWMCYDEEKTDYRRLLFPELAL